MGKKIVVIGGTGLIGSKVVQKLKAQGYEAVAAAPNTGVNTLTGEGLAEALRNASVVVDVSNSPSLEEKASMDFFRTSTTNLLSYEGKAGVKHHVALSVVGADRLRETPYIRAKIEQERLVRESGIPYSIVHATQFFEFWKGIADAGSDGNEVRVPPVFIQPIAADDVATALANVAAGAPLNGMVEVAGPQRLRFDEFIRQGLRSHNDPRVVIADPNARYFGAKPGELTLVASADARLGQLSFDDWLSPAMAHR